MKNVIRGLLIVLSLASAAAAGKYNPTLNVGDAAPAWNALPGVDDRPHSLDELKDKPFVLVVFTCNSCPYAVDYEDRIIALTKKHADSTAVVAINVNKVPEDGFGEMKKRATAKQFPYSYLYDETQQIAKAYGATFTPEFFLLNRERKVIYMGALDDHSDAVKATINYVEQAITAVQSGQLPKIGETVGRGCLVRYARERKRKE